MESKVVWQDGMAFEAHLDGFNFTIDAAAKVGGQDKGPKPKGLTLVSLAGCTAMDVISILKKMRVEPDHFEVGTDGKLTGEHPKKFTDLDLLRVMPEFFLPEDQDEKDKENDDENKTEEVFRSSRIAVILFLRIVL